MSINFSSKLNQIILEDDLRHPGFDNLGLSYGFISKTSRCFGSNTLEDTSLIHRPKQIHSDILIHVSDLIDNPNIQADAIYTDRSEPIGVVTADCVPILCSDSSAKFLLAIHAGWRGLTNNLISNSILKVYKNQGINTSDILVLIQPAILPNFYEVKSDVIEKVSECIGKDNLYYCSLKFHKDSFLLDCQILACIRLIQLGISPSNIYVSRLDTYSTDEFHSYRRDKLQAGRNFSFISK